MKDLITNKDYNARFKGLEKEEAISFVKKTFEEQLTKNLNLTKIQAPLFVDPLTGLNDNLNGYERAVSFDSLELNKNLEVVQSLAKWKRTALKKYNVEHLKGIFTNMVAIRRDEELDNIHSMFVDQWDWEMVINSEDRKISFLKKIVKKVYKSIYNTKDKVCKKYNLENKLPKEITFVTSKELEQMYPNNTPKERETIFAKENRAIFIIGIGGKLKSGEPHDGRAADYDDWKLNGDLIVYYDMHNKALELSSMGIRVDKDSIVKQIKVKKEEYKLELPYVKSVINNEIPLSIGGGIGQSRICMFMLDMMHVGEVSPSVWSDSDVKYFKDNNIDIKE